MSTPTRPPTPAQRVVRAAERNALAVAMAAVERAASAYLYDYSADMTPGEVAAFRATIGTVSDSIRELSAAPDADGPRGKAAAR